jgi:UDP-N-acetylglucosamine 2-epimerase (non-hydrolysing)
MVLTDGGSIQEECAFLNKKCLIIRNTTERSDGIGINAMLWGFDVQKTKQFSKWTINEKEKGDETHSPAKEIVDCLVRRYYASLLSG